MNSSKFVLPPLDPRRHGGRELTPVSNQSFSLSPWAQSASSINEGGATTRNHNMPGPSKSGMGQPSKNRQQFEQRLYRDRSTELPAIRLDGTRVAVQERKLPPSKLPLIVPRKAAAMEAGKTLAVKKIDVSKLRQKNLNTSSKGTPLPPAPAEKKSLIGQFLQARCQKRQDAVQPVLKPTLKEAKEIKEATTQKAAANYYVSVNDIAPHKAYEPQDPSEKELREHYLMPESKFRLVRENQTVFCICPNGARIPMWKSQKGLEKKEQHKLLGEGSNGIVTLRTTTKAVKVPNQYTKLGNDKTPAELAVHEQRFRTMNEGMLDSLYAMHTLDQTKGTNILQHVLPSLHNVKHVGDGKVSTIMDALKKEGSLQSCPREMLDEFVTAVFHMNQHGLAHNDLARGPAVINDDNVVVANGRLNMVDTLFDFANNGFIKNDPNPFFQWVCLPPQNWNHPDLLPYWGFNNPRKLTMDTLKSLVLNPSDPARPIYIPPAVRTFVGLPIAG